MAEKIQLRIDQLQAADSVDDLIRYHIGKCHRLQYDREDQYAMRLVGAWRLVFTIEEGEIQVACIIEIVDYH